MQNVFSLSARVSKVSKVQAQILLWTESKHLAMSSCKNKNKEANKDQLHTLKE
jgi:hypothetical protein